MKKIELPLLLIVIIIVSGCIGRSDVAALVKNTEVGKEFLAEYPNAGITAVRLSKDSIENIIEEIRENCDESIPVKPYWRVTFHDPDTETEMIIWVDVETQDPICFIKKGGLVTTTTTSTTTSITSTDLDLDIILPKTSFEVGETFNGTYRVLNVGAEFDAYIVGICRKEGYEKECAWKSKGSDKDLKVVANPCIITDTITDCIAESFGSAGTYIFELRVYECGDLERELGVECGIDIDHNIVAVNVEPLSTLEKFVTVTETGITSTTTIPECMNNEECTQSCENCVLGKRICANIDSVQKCVECITDSQCLSGYFCNETIYECQEEYEEPPLQTCIEQEGSVCSTGDGCVCYGTLLESSDVACCCQGACNPTVGTSPQDVLKKWFEGQVEGDNDKVFANTVDLEGNEVTENCKTAYQPWISSYTENIYEFEIESTDSCINYVPEGIDCTAVSYSYIKAESGKSATGSASRNTMQLLDINGEWKVQIDFSYLC